MERCTDMYGNIDIKLKVGAVVENDVVIYTVGEIYQNGMVAMDANKPYKIKKTEHPMAKCIKSGNYAALAPTLCFGKLG